MTPTALSRRAFLALAGTVPLAARAFAAASQVPVGLELYSVRDFLAKDLHGTVRAVARLGYEVVEFYSPYYSWTPQQAADVRKLLDELGVKCPSTHNGVNAISPEGIQKAIDLNQAIGSKAIILASPGPAKTLDDFKALSDKLNAAADRLRPLGMVTGFHNHQREWRPLDGERPMDVIAARTAKDVVLQFDVGTAIEVGVDAVAWIKANPGRIRSMHCKDYSAGGKGYAVLFGEGDVPWKPIFEAAESVGGIEHYIVEQEAGLAEEQLKRVELCLANWKKLRSS
jgi:sugar phosphate isomerase/epimerase